MYSWWTMVSKSSNAELLGLPATEVIEQSIREALAAGGAREVRVQMQLAPAWTTDWLRRPLRKSYAPTALRHPAW